MADVPSTMAEWPDLATLLTLVMMFGVAAGVITMVPARLWRGWSKARGRRSPWWQNATLHAFALLTGAGLGWLTVGWPWGFACGVAGGGLAAYIVGLVKDALRHKVGPRGMGLRMVVDNEDEELSDE